MSATEGDAEYFTGLYNIYLDNMAKYKTKALLGTCFAGGLLLAGISAAAIGDLDGDGITDLAVGAGYDDDGGADRGAVWILFLNPDGTVLH